MKWPLLHACLADSIVLVIALVTCCQTQRTAEAYDWPPPLKLVRKE